MSSSNRNANLFETLYPCHKVRSSCRAFWTTHVPNNNNNNNNNNNADETRCSVRICKDKLNELADSIVDKIQTQTKTQVFAPWDEGGCHYVGNGIEIGIGLAEELEQEFSSYRAECVALYVLTLDALNFCFWPTPNGEKIPYEHLAVALKVLAERWEDGVLSSSSSSSSERSVWEEFPFTAQNLATLTEAQFLEDLHSTNCFSVMLPGMSERCRLLNELGQGLLEHHNGSALDMIRKANRSASRLSSIIVNTFSGFQDSCIDPFTGKQLFFYKRAQIAVADLWAAFQCIGLKEDKNPCLFYDIESITTFADYRVPQILRHYGVLEYNEDLSKAVDEERIILAGSADEISIRTATVVVVDELVVAVNKKLDDPEKMLNAVRMDWHLWQVGEKMDWDDKLKPHHRTRTIFY